MKLRNGYLEFNLSKYTQVSISIDTLNPPYRHYITFRERDLMQECHTDQIYGYSIKTGFSYLYAVRAYAGNKQSVENLKELLERLKLESKTYII